MIAQLLEPLIELKKKDLNKFVFRSTRGNTLVHFEDFKTPIMDFNGKEIWKTVYLLVFPKGESIRAKLITLWDSFLGERFDIPKGNIIQEISLVNKRIEETKQLIISTQENIK